MSVEGLEPAKLATAGQVYSEGEIGQAAPLGAGLEDAAGAAGRLGQREALRNVLGARLLAIDTLAGIGRQDGGCGVPVRARGDEDGFNVAAGQQIAQVAVHGAILVAVFSVVLLFDGLPARGLHGPNGDEPQVRFLQETAQVVSAPVADADCAQDNAFAGGDTAVPDRKSVV